MSLTKKIPQPGLANNSHGDVDAEAADADARLELVDAAAVAADARLELVDAAAAAADARLELVDAGAAAVADRLSRAYDSTVTMTSEAMARLRRVSWRDDRPVFRSIGRFAMADIPSTARALAAQPLSLDSEASRFPACSAVGARSIGSERWS